MQLLTPKRKLEIGKLWYRFRRNPLSIIGLSIVLTIIFLAIFAPWFSPQPEAAGFFIDWKSKNQPPSWAHPCGTDLLGRDILSRIFFGLRYSLSMAVVVLSLVVPSGVILGLIAGYFKGTWIDMVIMRITDVFLSVPPLVFAMAVCAILTPSVFNAMMAVSLMWWPWYCRLSYSLTASLRNEFFTQSAEVLGAPTRHILFREILPNCLAPIFTKMTLDVGWVILIGASISFVGLGAQPPTPDLGTMVADGRLYLPDLWWISVMPGLAIVFTVLAFNLLGDGIRDMLTTEEI